MERQRLQGRGSHVFEVDGGNGLRMVSAEVRGYYSGLGTMERQMLQIKGRVSCYRG